VDKLDGNFMLMFIQKFGIPHVLNKAFGANGDAGTIIYS
jgi:hypothetical protein